MSVEVVAGRSGADVRRILEALPDWFGDPVAIDNYAAAAEDRTFGSLLALRDGIVVGVALVHRRFPTAAELHLIAVHPAAHGTGVGRSLVDRVAADLSADGGVVLSVHTVGPSYVHEPYARTRAFYLRLGFIPLEEHDGLDWPGPTLIMVRPLIDRVRTPR